MSYTDDELVRRWADLHRGKVYRDMGTTAAVVARLDAFADLADRARNLLGKSRDPERASPLDGVAVIGLVRLLAQHAGGES